ncbi:helix-turn-helix transcriptional regulator [Variovorax sp. RHLX14]|uniref:helix-turn-helix transcriptional regulator n=1 Tax=Variovorax sp. RHLX14 TaxID=1259731 RepID=UPI003F46DCF9
MNFRGLEPATRTSTHDAHAAMADVIDAMGRDHFASSALASLSRAMGIGSWSVYRLWRDRPPVMHLSASRDLVDTTGECFSIYRDRRLYLRDSSFEAVRRDGVTGRAVMLHMRAEEAPNTEHRDAIYRNHGMVERVSVARAEADGSLLAVNAYSHDAARCSGEAMAERFGDIASTLIAVVARHVEWTAAAVAAPPPSTRDALRNRCPALTDRELDVLERLLKGITYDGIAADMQLSVCTVKTYRARAFERLDIHFKSELFALFVAPTHA